MHEILHRDWDKSVAFAGNCGEQTEGSAAPSGEAQEANEQADVEGECLNGQTPKKKTLTVVQVGPSNPNKQYQVKFFGIIRVNFELRMQNIDLQHWGD